MTGVHSKVPRVTFYFWIIKVLCTTSGETAADYLIDNFLGLVSTTYVMSAALIVALLFQLRARKYIPSFYWTTVVLLSIVGTLVTDILSDKFQVSLVTLTALFTVFLAGVFLAWYTIEKTLSIHSIFTRRRELFYWLAILITFALGTAAGDLSAETVHLGYRTSILVSAGLIAAVSLAYQLRAISAVLAFWIAYVLTRPLGASIGDYLSQPPAKGGTGFGSTTTSFLFLFAILALVAFLSLTRRDEQPLPTRSK